MPYTHEKYLKNKTAILARNKLYRQKFPWYDCWRNAHARCEDPRNKNFARLKCCGIICTLTKQEVSILWKRDNASSLNIPSIDRIDTKKNYEFSNCRFVEFIDNVNRRHHKKHFLNQCNDGLLKKDDEILVCRNCQVILPSRYSICGNCYPDAI